LQQEQKQILRSIEWCYYIFANNFLDIVTPSQCLSKRMIVHFHHNITFAWAAVTRLPKLDFASHTNCSSRLAMLRSFRVPPLEGCCCPNHLVHHTMLPVAFPFDWLNDGLLRLDPDSPVHLSVLFSLRRRIQHPGRLVSSEPFAHINHASLTISISLLQLLTLYR